jgi:hypothetical protein
VEAAASRQPDDLRTRLDAEAQAQQRAGAKTQATAAPEGRISVPAKGKPTLQNAADISELRKRIATERTAGTQTNIPGVGPGPAPARGDAEPQKPRVELSDREVTSRLLERKRKSKDE